MIRRRDLLRHVAGGIAASQLALPATRLWGGRTRERTGLGIVLYCCGLRQRWGKPSQGEDLADPIRFLEHARQLGAGGIQVPLGTRDPDYLAELRCRAESAGMFIEGIAGLPQTAGEVERFAAQMRTAREAGARAVRVVIVPGRRYERFDSRKAFDEAVRRGRQALERAEPIARRHGIPLAVENHKDQRVPERLALLERISSPYVGACVDTGNSLALLEDPMEVVRAYAPWAVSVHLKDQAVQEYADGFLLADVPLGQGFLNLPALVRLLRQAKPDLPCCLEMITRDPLQVPCLAEPYWATLADVPARDLARTLRTVRRHGSPDPLPQVSRLSPKEQVAREDGNVKQSLEYARDHLPI